MGKYIITLVLAIATGLLSCRSFNSTEKWEGISENRLKIVISEFFPFDENISNEKISVLIKHKLDTRASLIMASHISINLAREKISQKNDLVLNDLINKALGTGKLINHYCSENNHCSAEAEYDLTTLLNKLSAINNQ